MSKLSADSEPAPTPDELVDPPETRVFSARAIRLGVDAALDGASEADCPWPADGTRAQRSARHFWRKGYRVANTAPE